jgi:two-component system, cell cycle response regulator
MRPKILSVDDSKTVRIIVKKAFKAFDVDIVEAANGVEGLSAAAKERPDLILLDVTMPVMDGVEMLTKLKADVALKAIPVIMLTAEGGKEHVIKIAKLGVRDYVVKPFKEEVLVEKVGRLIELKPATDAVQKAKSILDPATILVVEDKPAIIQQFQDGLKHTPWTVVGAATAGEAIDACGKTTPDLIIISLSLPDEGGQTLFRMLRNQVKTKHTPVFGMAVKTDTALHDSAQQIGFTTIVTKPLEISDIETKVAKAMNLDTSLRYFASDPEFFTLRLPENINPTMANEVLNYLKGKTSEAVDNGLGKAIIDLSALKRLDLNIIKLLLTTMQTFKELALIYAVVGNAAVIAESKAYEDTKDWQFHPSAEQARAAIGRPAAVAA